MSLFHLREFHKGMEPHLKALSPCPILLHQSVFISTVNCAGAKVSGSVHEHVDVLCLW